MRNLMKAVGVIGLGFALSTGAQAETESFSVDMFGHIDPSCEIKSATLTGDQRNTTTSDLTVNGANTTVIDMTKLGKGNNTKAEFDLEIKCLQGYELSIASLRNGFRTNTDGSIGFDPAQFADCVGYKAEIVNGPTTLGPVRRKTNCGTVGKVETSKEDENSVHQTFTLQIKDVGLQGAFDADTQSLIAGDYTDTVTVEVSAKP